MTVYCRDPSFFIKRSCTRPFFRSRRSRKPAKNANPALNIMRPVRNCTQLAGKGKKTIPYNESLISFMPPAAITPGIKSTIKAAKRAIKTTPLSYLILTAEDILSRRGQSCMIKL